MTSNSGNGKTSAAKTLGSYICLVGTVMLLYSTFAIRDVAILNAILFSGTGVLTIGAGLIAGKIVKPTQRTHTVEDEDLEYLGIQNKNSNN